MSDRVSLDASDEELRRRYAEVRALGERLLGQDRLGHEERARLVDVRDAARALALALDLLPDTAALRLSRVYGQLVHGASPRAAALQVAHAAAGLIGEGGVGR